MVRRAALVSLRYSPGATAMSRTLPERGARTVEGGAGLLDGGLGLGHVVLGGEEVLAGDGVVLVEGAQAGDVGLGLVGGGAGLGELGLGLARGGEGGGDVGTLDREHGLAFHDGVAQMDEHAADAAGQGHEHAGDAIGIELDLAGGDDLVEGESAGLDGGETDVVRGGDGGGRGFGGDGGLSAGVSAAGEVEHGGGLQRQRASDSRVHTTPPRWCSAPRGRRGAR